MHQAGQGLTTASGPAMLMLDPLPAQQVFLQSKWGVQPVYYLRAGGLLCKVQKALQGQRAARGPAALRQGLQVPLQPKWGCSLYTAYEQLGCCVRDMTVTYTERTMRLSMQYWGNCYVLFPRKLQKDWSAREACWSCLKQALTIRQTDRLYYRVVCAIPEAALILEGLLTRQAQKALPARGSCRSSIATLAGPSSPSANIATTADQ